MAQHQTATATEQQATTREEKDMDGMNNMNTGGEQGRNCWAETVGSF